MHVVEVDGLAVATKNCGDSSRRVGSDSGLHLLLDLLPHAGHTEEHSGLNGLETVTNGSNLEVIRAGEIHTGG